MARSWFSSRPSPYPRAVFHTIRAGQVISSIITTGVLWYFIYWLGHDNWYIPWTFILLLAVSSFTNASIIITAYFYHLRFLKPSLSVYINAFLTVLWAVGFALLTWHISYLLTNTCSIDNWENSTGVSICRMYKVLETFTITGLLFTAASLILDIRTLRSMTQRGVYNQPGDDKRPVPANQRVAGHDDEFSATMDHSFGQNYREPSLEFPEYSHESRTPYKTQKPIIAQNFGYSAPSEQTRYDGAGI